VTFGGGILQFGGNLGTLTSTIANSSAAMVIDTNGFNGTISGNLTASNAGGLTKMGLGTLTLSRKQCLYWIDQCKCRYV